MWSIKHCAKRPRCRGVCQNERSALRAEISQICSKSFILEIKPIAYKICLDWQDFSPKGRLHPYFDTLSPAARNIPYRGIGLT